MAPSPVVALFDLDGTITRHDTLGPYVGGYLARHPWRALGLPLVVPTVARFAAGSADEGALKSAFIRHTLGGSTRGALEDWTTHFIKALVPRGLFADALTRIEAHRVAGDHLVLLSASTDLYVPKVGEALGFGRVICTGLTWADERLVGTLSTPNRRGEEKVRCLARLREQYPQVPVVAYGNTSEDLPHLAQAERAQLVNGSARARAEAQALGIECVDWA